MQIIRTLVSAMLILVSLGAGAQDTTTSEPEHSTLVTRALGHDTSRLPFGVDFCERGFPEHLVQCGGAFESRIKMTREDGSTFVCDTDDGFAEDCEFHLGAEKVTLKFEFTDALPIALRDTEVIEWRGTVAGCEGSGDTVTVDMTEAGSLEFCEPEVRSTFVDGLVELRVNVFGNGLPLPFNHECALDPSSPDCEETPRITFSSVGISGGSVCSKTIDGPFGNDCLFRTNAGFKISVDLPDEGVIPGRKILFEGWSGDLRSCVGKDNTVSPLLGEIRSGEIVSCEVNLLVEEAPEEFELDPRRSLFVTDVEILDAFPLDRTLDSLLSSVSTGITNMSVEVGQDPHALWSALWDTQESSIESGREIRNACDAQQIVDSETGETAASINGFPIECPRPERDQGFFMSSYVPIALVNRFDLTPADGQNVDNCGQYRIVYAMRDGGGDRNFVILEAELPNPDQTCGTNGCRQIAEFWASLSDPRIRDDMFVQREMLQAFFYEGKLLDTDGFTVLGEVSPVFHYKNFVSGAGQIRTNQFTGGADWQLRQFRLRPSCGLKNGVIQCAINVDPGKVDGNPSPELFSDAVTFASIDAKRAPFADDVMENARTLLGDDINRLSFSLPNRAFGSGEIGYDAGQSTVAFSDDYNIQFNMDPNRSLDNALSRVEAETGIQKQHVISRMKTQSCAGCHELSNGEDLGGGLRWPNSLGFVHVSEFEEFTPDGHIRFPISPALEEVFLPHRQQVMSSYLEQEAQCKSPRLARRSMSTSRSRRSSKTDIVPMTLGGKATTH